MLVTVTEYSNSLCNPKFCLLAKSHNTTADRDCVTGLLLKDEKARRLIHTDALNQLKSQKLLELGMASKGIPLHGSAQNVLCQKVALLGGGLLS